MSDRTAWRIRATARPRVPACRISSMVTPAYADDLGVIDIGDDAKRLSEDPHVDHRRRASAIDQPIADVRNFRPLGVEGADNDDVGDHPQSWINGSTCSLAFMTIQS